jgi:hypothetical protein
VPAEFLSKHTPGARDTTLTKAAQTRKTENLVIQSLRIEENETTILVTFSKLNNFTTVILIN